MKIKRIKKIKVNSVTFDVIWDSEIYGGSFSYGTYEIRIGTKDGQEIFETICHELMEIVACEMRVRLIRTDCDTDYIFVYDHRQHTTMMAMFAGLLSQFIK